MISRMRSRPAIASLICVPIDAMFTTGAASRPTNAVYVSSSPSVIAPRITAGPPSAKITKPTSPTTTVEPAVVAGHAGDRARDVAEEAVHALREHRLLAPLGAVRLHDADAVQRLVQPPGDLRVDLAALAEDRPQRLERRRHPRAEDRQQHEDRERHHPVEVQQHGERERA
jgi:hypothetical protein